MMINTTASDWNCNANWPFVLPETDANKEADACPQLGVAPFYWPVYIVLRRKC